MTRSSEDLEFLEKRHFVRRGEGESVAPRRIVSSVRRVTSSSKKVTTAIAEPGISESRKAPTPLAAHREVHIEKKRQLITIGTLLILGVVASAGVGLLDDGQIDVQQVIEARNERIRNNQADERDVLVSQFEVPVQDTTFQGKADGGLIGRGTGGRVPVVSEVASTTATSTDETASSTDLMASSTESGVDETEEVLGEDVPLETTEETILQ
ncbi:hypothetical protein GW937_01140 [Candidatus Kaiserbacteria bacterium]|nr:hypothetical protein [Candidatus Kaiserbacteria bacterium]NCT01915.1 hypothetical protein [Candidatus Parcubacteria bacterium]